MDDLHDPASCHHGRSSVASEAHQTRSRQAELSQPLLQQYNSQLFCKTVLCIWICKIRIAWLSRIFFHKISVNPDPDSLNPEPVTDKDPAFQVNPDLDTDPGSASGSVPKCHGSATLLTILNYCKPCKVVFCSSE